MRDLVEAAHSYKSVEKFGCKKKIMEYIVHNIDQYASNPRRSKAQESIFNKIKYFGESLFCGSGIYLGNYLVTTYFFIKIVYLVNSIVQFFIMNEFLGKQFHELGLDILRYLTNSYSLENSIESVYFPKVRRIINTFYKIYGLRLIRCSFITVLFFYSRFIWNSLKFSKLFNVWKHF